MLTDEIIEHYHQKVQNEEVQNEELFECEK